VVLSRDSTEAAGASGSVSDSTEESRASRSVRDSTEEARASGSVSCLGGGSWSE
jgi:hypothetical protein